MNKSEFIDRLATSFNGNRRAAAQALDAVMTHITREVARGEKVAITGFGAFEKAIRPARMVRNPQTGARIRAKKTSVPKFRAGADLKAVVSGAKKSPTAVVATAVTAARAASSSTTKRTTAKKSPAKKSTAKKSTAKRSPAKKSTAKKTAAKRSTAKKSTAKKSTAKKSTAKKSTAKRSTAKRSPAKKSTAKRAAKKS